MPEFTLEFEVYCSKCGAGLCNQSRTEFNQRRGLPSVHVEPCQHCLDEAKSVGDDEGHARGVQEMQDQIDAALV